MEIALTKLQLEKIIRLLEVGNDLQSKISSLEEQISVLKSTLDERRKNQNDIIETILECNGVELSKVKGLNLTDKVLQVYLEEPKSPEPIEEIETSVV